MKPVVKVIQTAKNKKQAWRKLDDLELFKYYNFRMNTVSVDSSISYQKLLGFGGAFTEAAAYTWANADEKSKDEIVKAYFDKEYGLAYNLGRTTIHGCDFSLEPYTYIEEGDLQLSTFDMSREDKWLIPFLTRAKETAGHSLGILASPWSPPAFMKDNKDINNGGRLLKKNYATWAEYMVKYIEGMKERGIEIDMISIQNEPAAKQEWASCKYEADEEAEFAVDYLYPALEKRGLQDKVKIVIWDHNRDLMFRRLNESMAYPGAREKVWGAAFHWYVSDKSEILTMVHEKFPEKHLLFTEGCVELVNNSGGTSSKAGIGAWKHGEIYGRNIIKDFNNYNEAWIDWNLLLNEIGGPNYVGNYCEAPVMYDRNTKEIMYNSSYYYIGHFSRYIELGAVRICCRNDVDKGLYSVSFKNPNGDIVTVVQNELNRKQRLALVVDGQGTNTEIPAHSITTFITKNSQE